MRAHQARARFAPAMARSGVVFALLTLIAACAPRVKVQALGDRDPLGGISVRATICVARATDGRFGSRRYAGTGDFVSERVADALRGTYPSVKLLAATDEDEAVETCRSKAGRYLIIPAIRQWEDRHSGWSWLRDRIQIRLRLVPLDRDTDQREVTYEGTMSRAEVAREFFLTGWTNERPEELLTERFDAAILALVAGGVP